MSSFNKIEKVKYTAPGQAGIALEEYMTFKNEETGEQYILLKLRNLLTQKVTKFSFKIHEYDETGFMLGEAEINYDLEADANESFIPKAKLKVSPNCKRIDFTLEYALFENIEYKDGEFKQPPFSLEEFRREEPLEEIVKAKIPIDKKAIRRQRKADRKVQKIENRARLKRTKKVVKGKVFTMKNVTKMTRPKAPIIFAVLNTLLITLGVMLISYYYSNHSTSITYNNLDYSINNDQRSVTLTDSNLSVTETSTTIPKSITIGEKVYTVTAIGEAAFKNTTLESITFSDEIIIGKSAFENCKKLKIISGGENVTYVSEMAFKGCLSLESISLDNATIIEDYAFSGCESLKTLYAPYAKAYGLSLEGCMSLSSLYLYNTYPKQLYKLFTDTIDKSKVPSPLNIYLTFDQYGEDFLYQLNTFKLYSYDPTNKSTALLEEGVGSNVDDSGVISVSSNATEVTITSEVTKINASLDYLAENCKNLTVLHIEAQSFEDGKLDVTKLKNLSKLEEFGMKYDLKLDASFLSNIPKLNTLYLYTSALSTNYNVPKSVTTLKIAYSSDNMPIYMSDFSGITNPENITRVEVTSGRLESDSLISFNSLEVLIMPIVEYRLNEIGVSSTLRELTLTGSYSSLWNGYVQDYNELRTVNINGNPESIESGAFKSCHNLYEVNLNLQTTHIYSMAFKDCPSLSNSGIVFGANFEGEVEQPLTDE